MTSLYNCRHSGDQYRISKFDSHFDLESSYLCTEAECECPAGHRPTCRHRQMLPKFINRNHIGNDWFFDYDRGGWVQGQIGGFMSTASDESPTESIAPAGLGSDPAPQAPTLGVLAESALASEASALGVPATVAPTGTIRRRV